MSWSADPPGVIAAGLAAAVTAVALAGTGTLDPHGMITSPALHDAANDQPTRFSPVCSRTPIPVCLNPAYAGYLTAVTTALEPVLSEVAGRPGAPVRISQAAAIYQQGPGNSVGILLDGTALRGTPAGPAPHLAGGTLEVLRNVTGMTGIGLLCAATLGGRLAWTGPVGYLGPARTRAGARSLAPVL